MLRNKSKNSEKIYIIPTLILSADLHQFVMFSWEFGEIIVLGNLAFASQPTLREKRASISGLLIALASRNFFEKTQNSTKCFWFHYFPNI